MNSIDGVRKIEERTRYVFILSLADGKENERILGKFLTRIYSSIYLFPSQFNRIPFRLIVSTTP